MLNIEPDMICPQASTHINQPGRYLSTSKHAHIVHPKCYLFTSKIAYCSAWALTVSKQACTLTKTSTDAYSLGEGCRHGRMDTCMHASKQAVVPMLKKLSLQAAGVQLSVRAHASSQARQHSPFTCPEPRAHQSRHYSMTCIWPWSRTNFFPREPPPPEEENIK